MLDSEESIRSHYRDGLIVGSYLTERFSKPLGRVQHQVQVDIINSVIHSCHIDNILEIACGPARLTAEIEGFQKGIAIDTSDQMLEIARQRTRNKGKWEFIKGDAFKLDFAERFQLIYTFRFVRHFRSADRMKLYNAIHKLLDDHGILVFDAVHYEKLAYVRKIENRGQGKEVYDKVYQSGKELENEMGAAGFEIVELKGLIHHFYIQAVISRISNKLRFDNIGIRMIRSLERYPLGRPLEWIVTCVKKQP
jgi:SAM-dependent methyltransferase